MLKKSTCKSVILNFPYPLSRNVLSVYLQQVVVVLQLLLLQLLQQLVLQHLQQVELLPRRELERLLLVFLSLECLLQGVPLLLEVLLQQVQRLRQLELVLQVVALLLLVLHLDLVVLRYKRVGNI